MTTTPDHKTQTTEEKIEKLNASIRSSGRWATIALIAIVVLSVGTIKVTIMGNHSLTTTVLYYVGIGIECIAFIKFVIPLASDIVKRALIEHDRDKASA